MNELKKILFVGGGTLGSVVPLLSVWQSLASRTTNCQAYWIGTKRGPEIKQVHALNIPFFSISSGKLRRYFSFKNLIDPFRVLSGFFQSLLLLKKINPSIVVGAGGFVQVPVIFAAKLLDIPVIIYQLDVRQGLANTICAKMAKVVAQALPDLSYSWSKDKAVYVGISTLKKQNHQVDKKIVIFGGGTGAKLINDVVAEMVVNMPPTWQVIHICGPGKVNSKLINKSNYQQLEIVLNDQFIELLAQARVVVSRAGMGALFEIGVLGKEAVIIPIANSHQEENAAYYAKKEAVVVIRPGDLNSEVLIAEIKKILAGDYPNLSKNIATIANYEGADKMAALILSNCK